MNDEFLDLFNKFLMYFYYLGLFVLSIYSLFIFKKISTNFKYLTVLIIVSFIAEITEYFAFLNKTSTIKTYHLSLIINMILFYYIFKPFFKKTKFLKIAGLVTIFGVLFSTYSSIFIDEFKGFPSNGLVVLSIISIGFSLFTLKQIIDNPTKKSLFTLPKFWLSISVLVFFTISYIQLTFYQFYYVLGMANRIIVILFRIIVILYYLGFFMAFYFNLKHNYANKS